MKKTIVVSGPPCSGKTVFINRIKEDNYINKEPFFNGNFDFVNANKIRENSLIVSDNPKVIHYDCMRSFKRGINFNIKTDPFLYYLQQQNKVYIIFLICPVNVLFSRMQERLSRIRTNISDVRLKKMERLAALYSDEDKYFSEYLKWYEFSKTISNHLYFTYGDKKDKHIFSFESQNPFSTI